MARIGLVLVVLTLVLGLAGYFGGKPLYHGWKRKRMLKVAEGCAARGDDQGAIRSFKIVLAADPNNSEAWRAVGEFLDSRQPGAGLGVWERLAAAEPARTELRYRAVRDALIDHDGPRARANLNAVPQGNRESSEYQLLAARTLIAENQLVEAVQALAKIVKYEGASGEAGFELDRIQLLSRDSVTRQEAEMRMRERVRKGGPQATEGLRTIVISEAVNEAYTLADADAEQLIRRPDATGEDQARFLDLELRTDSFSVRNSMNKALARGLERPNEIGPILEVLGKWGKGEFAMRWLESQPAEKLAADPIRRARIWLAFGSHDTERAFALLGTGEHAMAPEKIANLRRIHEELAAGNPKALEDWNAVLNATEQGMDSLFMMSALASAWQWPEAQESAYWAMTNIAPGDPQVWRGLLSVVSKRGDTATILRAVTGLAKADPNLLEARTLALNLNFLLGYGDKTELLRTAEADAAISPAVDTQLIYAMLLTSVGRNSEAIAVADKIIKSANAEPTIRQKIYLGYIYAAAGNPDKARQWFVSADAARGHVLPEELAFALKATQLAEESGQREALLRSRPMSSKPRDRNPNGDQSVFELHKGDGTQPLSGKGMPAGGDGSVDALFLPIVGTTPTPRGNAWPGN